MTIPEGGIIVKHSAYASHLLKHELGLIEEVTDDKGKVVEVEIYQKEVDADRNGTIEKDREILDTDGDGKIHPMEVWEFFIRNMDYLAQDGVRQVIVSLCLELQESSNPLPRPGSRTFITYQAIFFKALQNKNVEIQAAALEALEILTPGKIYPAKIEPLPSDRKLISAGVIKVTIESNAKKQIDANGDQIISSAELESFFLQNINRLPEEETKKAVADIARQVSLHKSAKHATLLGQLAVINFKHVRDYKEALIRASQSDLPHLRKVATDAIKIFLVMEQGYYQAHPDEKPKTDQPYVLLPAPQNLQMCLERTDLPEGYIELEIAEVTEKKTGEKRRAIIDGDTIKVLRYGNVEKSSFDKLKVDQGALWGELLAAGYIDESGQTQKKLYLEIDNVSLNEKYTPEQRQDIIDILEEALFGGVRFKGANTTEFGKGPTLESRLERAEPGAIKAWEEIKGLLTLAGYKVYVRPERLDHYGRFISQVFVKAPGGKFIDVEAFLVSRGLGMAYFVQVTDPQAYSCFLSLQEKAQQERRGIWSLPEFRDRNDPQKQRLKILHITSFHPKGAKEKEVEEPLYNEYFRLVNISDQPINLMDYKIYNKRSGKYVELPYFIVPPGRTVKIASGDIETNADPNDPEKDLVLSLLFKKPFWENEEKDTEGTCLIIQDLKGRTVDSSAKYKYKGCE